MSLPSEPMPYAAWIGVLVSIGITVDSLEILYSRHDYSSRGLLSWDILKLDSRFVLAGRSGLIIRNLLGYPGYLVLISIQLLAAVTVLSHQANPLLPYLITAILGIKLLSHFRHAHGGLDGSDQMQIIILASLAAFYWVTDPMVKMAALWFIAAQLILSYLAAGVAKLVSATWRSGDAIVGVLATDNYGNRLVGSWVRQNRHAAPLICWSVILFECLAPALVFLGPIPCMVFLGMGLLFHLSIAVAMGLNNFLWSFGAAYPAVLFLVKSLPS